MRNSNKLLCLMILVVIGLSATIIALPIIKLKMGKPLISKEYNSAGPVECLKYSLDDFDSLSVSGIANVKVVQSNENKIFVYAPKKLQDCVKYKIFGNELKVNVNPAKRFLYRGNVDIVVKTKDLNYVRTTDICSLMFENLDNLKEIRAGDLSYIKLKNVRGIENFRSESLCYLIANKISSKDLNIRMDGVTIAHLSGNADYVDIRGDGIGRIYGKKFLAKNVDVNLDGFIYVYLSVLDNLNVDNLDGITKFMYYGTPRINKGHIDGLGKLVYGGKKSKQRILNKS